MRPASSSLFLAALAAGRSAALATLDKVLLFQPPDNYTDPRTLYARTTQLSDGRLLATWENYSPEPPAVYFPVYESADGGASWAEVSRVEDQVYGFGLRYQPVLYELPRAFGDDFPAGTVLLAGSAIPTNLSETNIELYASRDQGLTWEFVSHIAHGGVALPNNGEWEPPPRSPRVVCLEERERTGGREVVNSRGYN